MAESTHRKLACQWGGPTNIVDQEFLLDPTHMFLEFLHVVLDKLIKGKSYSFGLIQDQVLQEAKMEDNDLLDFRSKETVKGTERIMGFEMSRK